MELNKINQAINKKKVQDIVTKYANLAHITDEKALEGIINDISSKAPDDAIDAIIGSLISLLNKGALTEEQILSNAGLILNLNPEKYKTTEDLVSRYKWLKSMNMVHTQMPLEENHKLVIEAFDKFNELIETDFDAFYTGGLMGYLATNHELERYHGDLDLLINEEQLEELRKRIEESKDFQFVSNMDHKEVNGHEYKITYKDTPMSVGLFLFSREADGGIITKEYYYPNQNTSETLRVDEHHLTPVYVSIMFDENIHEHNGIPFRMQSLESIYDAKKNGRPKDRYDADIIRDSVDMGIVEKYDEEKQFNYDVNGVVAAGSVVDRMESRLKREKDEGRDEK